MMKQNDSHISSFIVYSRPEKQDVIEQALLNFDHLELHGTDGKGKFVVVTEAPHQGVILDRIEKITALEGVVDVSMVYHQVMANGELGDEIKDESANKLMTSKDHIQFCESDALTTASQH